MCDGRVDIIGYGYGIENTVTTDATVTGRSPKAPQGAKHF